MRRVLIWLGGAVGVSAATGALLWMVTAGAASFQVDGSRLIVSGTLTLASTERIDTLVEQTPGLTTLVLGEIGEDSDATALLQKGALIRSLGMTTLVAPGVTISGPAVFLFLGGVERRLGEDAEIAVSDWQTNVGPASALPADHPAHAERRGFVARMLGGPDFYDFMIGAAPVGGAHRVTDQQVAEFGLVTGG
ncbi:MAG: hypothetical protein AAF376_11005 [Pseudomonadota bacterium]